MATMPTAEDLILEIHQSLGLEQFPTKVKNDYRAFDLELGNFSQKTAQLLGEIFDALDMDGQARSDALNNLLEWVGFHEELSQHVWTGATSPEQVTWHMLAYSYVPALARHLAFWSLAGAARGVPMDAGMPGGEFWFLPSIDQDSDTFKLPVAKVVDWLFALVAPTTVETLNEAGLGRSPEVLRTLQNWRDGRNIPQSAKKIDEIFSDNANLVFNGVLSLDLTCSLAERMTIALEFVRRKNLATAELLHTQLPMTVSRLMDVLTGVASEREQEEFLYWLGLRYAQPTMKTIRQRLKAARMVQDGFERLMKFLVPDTEPSGHLQRLRLSKQLLGLFQSVYNLTVEAYQQAETDAEQDAWFESRLTPWDKADLLLSIVPSLPGHVRTALLGGHLTRHFMALAPDSLLPDLVAVDDSAASKEVVKQRLLMLKAEADEQMRLLTLRERMGRSSPWRALQQENDFTLVLQLAQDVGLPERWAELVRDRCRELASSPEEQVELVNVELTGLFALMPKNRPQDMQERVQTLLAQAEASAGYDMWKAPLLRWRGRHCLLQNDFKAAIKYHREALEACKERQFGNLSGEIARDGWAVELAVNGFIPNNQQHWHRRLLRDSRFADVAKSPENAAVWLWEEFLVPELYQPYPGVERSQLNGSPDDWGFVCNALSGFSANQDWDGLTVWLKRQSAKCRKMRLDRVRKNTVLMQWIKFVHHSKRQFCHDHALQLGVSSDDWAQQQALLEGWQKTLFLMVQEWPEQAQMADFKGQTPLMLVADHGDIELTRLLTPLSDVNAQDSLGRTALHAAVASRSPQCVEVVLEREPLVADKVTNGECNTPLHTTVRFGCPECVRLILEEYPSLASQKNALGQTPLGMAGDICVNWPEWVEFMRGEGRATGSLQEFKKIVELLSAAGT